MNDLISWFEREFARLEQSWRALIEATDDERLYQVDDQQNLSVGEQVLRSARIVEQTFGGITANLWDDPFEWTLPESLSTPESVLSYLREVEATRRRGFDLIKTEEDLTKEIMAASGVRQLLSLLLDTLVR